MNTPDSQSFAMRVRVAECHRYTVASSKSYAETEPVAAGRQIRLRNCAILETTFERAEGRPATDDKIELWIDEFYAGLLDIGSFSSFRDIRLRLPPTTFSHFWTASAASDWAERDITIYFKAEAEAFKITRVLLVEHVTNREHVTKRDRTRVLPGNAETRDMKWASILLGFLVAFAIGAILAAIGHEFWRGFNHG